MSFLGKILVVMQLVIAVAFMCFAGAVYTYHTSWKDKAKGYQEDYELAQGSIVTLTQAHDTIKNRLQAELDTAKSSVSRTSADNETLKNEIASLKSDVEEYKNSLQTQLALSKISAAEATARGTETITQRKANSQLHKRLDVANKKNLDHEKSSFQVSKSMSEMQKKHGQLLKELAIRTKIMKANDLEDDLETFVALQQPVPKVDGVVTDIKIAKNGLVELVTISLGSNDGFVVGHRLVVYNSGLTSNTPPQYLGDVEIVLVRPNEAVGRIVEKSKNGIVRKGNNVTTKFE